MPSCCTTFSLFLTLCRSPLYTHTYLLLWKLFNFRSYPVTQRMSWKVAKLSNGDINGALANAGRCESWTAFLLSTFHLICCFRFVYAWMRTKREFSNLIRNWVFVVECTKKYVFIFVASTITYFVEMSITYEEYGNFDSLFFAFAFILKWKRRIFWCFQRFF